MFLSFSRNEGICNFSWTTIKVLKLKIIQLKSLKTFLINHDYSHLDSINLTSNPRKPTLSASLYLPFFESLCLCRFLELPMDI